MSSSTIHGARPSLGELLDGLSKVSGHRQVLLRLNAFLASENAGFQELVEILRTDAGLSARVISAANTVFFRGGLLVSSVDEAVARVGVAEICRLLHGSIAYELTSGALRSYGVAAGELWNRSLVCAFAMDALAEKVHRSRDVCYTIGLMHALGMIVVDRWLTQHRLGHGAPLADDAGRPDAECERALVGHTSSELGARLLEVWRFPENTVSAIEHQDDPLEAGRFNRLASLLCVARWLGGVILVGRNFDQLTPSPNAVIFECAGLEAAAVRELIDPVRAAFAKQKAALGVF